MKITNPTLLILTPGFPSNELETTCLPFLQTFLKNLKKRFPKLNIIVVTFHYPYFKGEYEWNGLKIISFGGRNRKKFLKLILWNRIQKKLNQLHKQNKLVGVLSLWCNECAFIGKRFCDKNGLRHFCWLWGQDAKKENKFVNRIRPRAEELIALSDFLQTEFENNFLIKPTHVIPPGIDATAFLTKNLNRDIDLLGVGSLIPLKQYDQFLHVVSELKKKLPDIKAVLCGSGVEEEKLQLLKTKLGLDSNLQFTGEIPHSEVLQLMQRSKIFLHPSSYEGFGCVCNEALYAGAQVISFCQPMEKKINHWHIVHSKTEMFRKALEILQSDFIDHQPISPFLIDDTVTRVMNLFQYKEEIAL